jgi:hypothetical protein
MALLILAFFLIYKYGSLPFKSKDKPRIESFLEKNGHPKRYTYADLKRMTKSFSVKLGQGGYADVYIGDLSNGCQVAVKMLKDTKASFGSPCVESTGQAISGSDQVDALHPPNPWPCGGLKL